MMALLAIAWLTMREIARRRLFIALVLVTAAAVGLSGWGFAQVAGFHPAGRAPTQLELDSIDSQLLILVTFMFSFILALGAAFIAAPMVAEDVESGVVLAMLARPLRRSELLLGKWLGIVVLVTAYAVLSGAVELAVVGLTAGYLPPHPTEAVLFLVGEAIVLLTLTGALATRLAAMTSAIVALVLFGLAWMGDIVGGIGVAIGNPTVQRVGELSRYVLPTDGLWRGTIYFLEPIEVLIGGLGGGQAARAYPFYEPAPPPASYVWWAVGWVVVVLAAGVLSFRRREL